MTRSVQESRRSEWLYVLFNEEAKQPVVLPFRGEGPPVLLIWNSRAYAETFLRSVPTDKKSLWRAYEWTPEDIGAWVHRNKALAGVEMNPGKWPTEGGALVDRDLCESLAGETTADCG
ncbi:MAG: hypothetical protein ABIH23_23545 [bacterium]